MADAPTLSAAVATAALAALGYVAKQGFDAFTGLLTVRRMREAQLVELQSLLHASDAAYQIQGKHARSLTDMLKNSRREIVETGKGFDDIFYRAYKDMSTEERELHGLIRSITVSTMLPTNMAMLAWLQKDTYFRVVPNHTGELEVLARMLNTLHSHLILWKAKYDYWITPEEPGHALVYLADEKEHGLGFPVGIDDLVNAAVRNRLPWL
jgi:hypothetical protein